MLLSFRCNDSTTRAFPFPPPSNIYIYHISYKHAALSRENAPSFQTEKLKTKPHKMLFEKFLTMYLYCKFADKLRVPACCKELPVTFSGLVLWNNTAVKPAQVEVCPTHMNILLSTPPTPPPPSLHLLCSRLSCLWPNYIALIIMSRHSQVLILCLSVSL